MAPMCDRDGAPCGFVNWSDSTQLLNAHITQVSFDKLSMQKDVASVVVWCC